MEWMNGISDILRQYNGARPDQAPDTVDDDFDQFAQAAPQSAVADGLAEAFRSDQTPPFGQMLGQIFGQSGGQQRASILNTLIAALGPTVISQVLQRGGGLSGLEGILGGGKREVTPEVAAQIPPEAVAEVAAEAERRDPSVIDRISDVYAEHPTLIKTLGGAALAIALARVAQRQYGR